MNPQTNDSERNTIRALLIALTLMAAFTIGYFLRPVLVPVVLAVFLAMLVDPLFAFLQKRLPRGVALSLTMVIVVIGCLSIPLIIGTQLQTVVTTLPKYSDRFNAIFTWINQQLSSMGVDISDFELTSGSGLNAIVAAIKTILKSSSSTFSLVLLVVFTVPFVLSETRLFIKKVDTVATDEHKQSILSSTRQIREQLQRYVVAKSLISLLTAMLTGLIVWALGIDFPFIWATLTFVMNFIPNIGSVISYCCIGLMALLQFDTLIIPITCLGLLLIVETIVGRFLEPKVMGKALSLSPLTVLLSMFFWGWYWGIVGVIISVPLTVVISIVCANIKGCEWVTTLLADNDAFNNNTNDA